MKIAIFHNLPSGGGKRALFEFIKRLSAAHDIDLFNLSCSNEEFSDLRPLVKRTFTFQYKTEKGFLRFNYDLLSKLARVNENIAEKINRGGYNLAFVNACFLTQSPYILRYLAIPSVYFCHEPRREFYENTWFAPPRIKSLITHFLRIPLKGVDYTNTKCANFLLVNSLYSKKSVDKIYGVNSIVNHLGVDCDRFKNLAFKREKLVLSVGAFSPSKAHDFIIRSLSLIYAKRRPKLVIVGNGGVTKLSLQILAKKLKVDLTLRENIGDKELIDWYNRASVFAYSPIAEPFGLAPLEAMACELPVIGADEGGYVEAMIDGKTGFLTKRNPVYFAKKIEAVLENRLVSRLGKAAREHMLKNWTWENSVKNLEKNFLRVIES